MLIGELIASGEMPTDVGLAQLKLYTELPKNAPRGVSKGSIWLSDGIIWLPNDPTGIELFNLKENQEFLLRSNRIVRNTESQHSGAAHCGTRTSYYSTEVISQGLWWLGTEDGSKIGKPFLRHLTFSPTAIEKILLEFFTSGPESAKQAASNWWNEVKEVG